jgi:hypothetical protein
MNASLWQVKPTAVVISVWCFTAVSLTSAPPANQTVGAGAGNTNISTKAFRFAAGTLREFTEEVKTVYGVDLREVAEIPEDMLYVRVPGIKVNAADLAQILRLYNQVSEEGKGLGLGRWLMEPGAGKTNGAIVLLPPGPTPTRADEFPAVRAFSLKPFTEAERDLLTKAIADNRQKLWQMVSKTGAGNPFYATRGEIHFHKETGLLVAMGGKPYVDLVTAIVEGFRERKLQKDPSPEERRNR